MGQNELNDLLGAVLTSDNGSAYGQTVNYVSWRVLPAWGFARYRFPGKNLLFMVYVALMMMPFQVMMLSNYLVLDQMELLDNLWGIILPAVFSTFPVLLCIVSLKVFRRH